MASGQFQDDDCSLFQSGATSAPKVNVFTVANHANQMVSVMPPAVGCALAVTADGLQGPGTECLGDYFAMPLVTAGTTAVMVAARDGATRGSYSFPVSVCPAGLLNYHSDIQPGTISGGDCHDATGVPADFYIVRLPRWLAMYNDGWSGHLVDVEFSHSAVSADGSGMAPLPDLFSTSIDDLWLLGLDVASAIVIRPTSTSGVGTYAIEVAPAIFHQ